MTLTFLGTRGEIQLRTRRHRMHSSLLISHRGARIMIDCGLDWIDAVWKVRPDAIVLTHAHIGHYTGLMFLGREVLSTRRLPVYVGTQMRDFCGITLPGNNWYGWKILCWLL